MHIHICLCVGRTENKTFFLKYICIFPARCLMFSIKLSKHLVTQKRLNISKQWTFKQTLLPLFPWLQLVPLLSISLESRESNLTATYLAISFILCPQALKAPHYSELLA